jgi:hypothetical protein
MSYNRFRNNNYKNTNIIKKKEFSLNINDYPELNLNSICKNDTNISNLKNFQDAILKPIEVEEDINRLEPGCVYIKRMPNNKIVYEYGPLSDKCKLEKYQEDINNNINNIMNNIITKINMNRERYRNEYNAINGNNAYEDFYEKYYIRMDEDSDYENEDFENIQYEDENYEKEDD